MFFKIFLATKPAPTVESKFSNRDMYQLGSLSHFVNSRAPGYNDLPGYPTEPPDSTVRNVEPPKPVENPWKKQERAPKKSAKKVEESSKFYDEPNGLDSATSDSEESSSSSDSESSSSESEEEAPKKPVPTKIRQVVAKKEVQQVKPAPVKKQLKESEESSSDLSSSSSDEEDEKPKPVKAKPKADPVPKSNLDLLLDLSDVPPDMPTPTLTPSLGGFLTPVVETTPVTATAGHSVGRS